MEELEDGSSKAISRLMLTPRGDHLIIADSREHQLILPFPLHHQLTVECLASHPQLGEDQVTYAHSIQILSKFSSEYPSKEAEKCSDYYLSSSRIDICSGSGTML